MSCGLWPVMSSPRKATCPLRGCRRPKIVLIRVDFPAPLGPITVTTSPSFTSSETPLRMSTSGTYPATRSSARSTTPLPAESSAAPPVRPGSWVPSATIATSCSRLRDRPRAQVRVDHPFVGAHVVRRPVGDHPALRHHDHAVGVVHHHLHVMLDKQERHALLGTQALHVVEQAAPQGGVDPRHRLVETQQPRDPPPRPPHLEQPALAPR